MFTFIHFSDTKELTVAVDPNNFKSEFMARYKKMLKEAGIHNTKVGEDSLSFTAPPFRYVWNGFNLMNGISVGKLHLTTEGNRVEVKYSHFFHELFIIALIFTPITIQLLHFLPQFLGSIAAIWGLYYLGTVCVTIYRYNKYMSEFIKECYLKCLSDHGV